MSVLKLFFLACTMMYENYKINSRKRSGCPLSLLNPSKLSAYILNLFLIILQIPFSPLDLNLLKDDKAFAKPERTYITLGKYP